MLFSIRLLSAIIFSTSDDDDDHPMMMRSEIRHFYLEFNLTFIYVYFGF